MAEKPKVSPVIIHDDKEFNPWPAAAAILVFLVLGVLVFEHRKTSQEVAQVATSGGPSLLVNDHSPLFQSPAGGTPQFAHTASLQNAPPASKAVPAAKDDTQEDDYVDPTDDSESLNTPVSAGPESVQLTDVQLASQDDGEGHEMSIGTATIYNPSRYEISGFQLYVATSGGTYRLQPFSGSADNPSPVESLEIPPGGKVTVPVMSNGVITVTDQNAAKTVTVEATENGSTVTSQATVD